MAAHHGSLSRKLRLDAEPKLKEGKIKVLVATASLELGIDIGTVDLVVQISSPRAIAVALQRVGRSGHWRGAIPKGRFFAGTRDELLECAFSGESHPPGRSRSADDSRSSARHFGAADRGHLRREMVAMWAGTPPANDGSRIRSRIQRLGGEVHSPRLTAALDAGRPRHITERRDDPRLG